MLSTGYTYIIEVKLALVNTVIPEPYQQATRKDSNSSKSYRCQSNIYIEWICGCVRKIFRYVFDALCRYSTENKSNIRDGREVDAVAQERGKTSKQGDRG